MTLTHEPDRHRFVVTLPQGRGELLYEPVGTGLLDLYHAEVSPSLRGRGIAGQLVEAACEHARTHQLKLWASCPYVAWWFRQHPEQRDLLAA